MLRWITPSPPACAMAMARADSVTVSMAAEIKGMPRSTGRVSRVRVLVSVGRTAEAAGVSSTSSNVNACRISKAAPVRQGGVALYTSKPAREAAGRGAGMRAEDRAAGLGIRCDFLIDDPRSLASESRRDDIDLRRLGTTRRRFGVAHGFEVALQRGEQGAFGTALKDLAEEGAAGRQAGAPEVEGRPRPRDHAHTLRRHLPIRCLPH